MRASADDNLRTAFISVLHLVSIVLLTLSLILGSGGGECPLCFLSPRCNADALSARIVVESVALGLDWLALIVMALFLIHRVRFPQREYIRPRSMTAFYGLTFFSACECCLPPYLTS